jgi:predicted Fe-Mo cluster-binding NifX family protein
MLGTDVIIAMRHMKIDAVIIGSSGNEMEQDFCDAGADWVWQKPIPSNETIIERLRGALPQLDLATADTFQPDDS